MSQSFKPGALVPLLQQQANSATERQLHELQMNQIELAMQSEALAELQQLKDEFEIDLNQYAELYEQAPVSYFSIERGGQIARANAAASALLGLDKSELMGKKFEQFVAPSFQGRFRQFINAVFDSGARQVLEADLFQGAGQVRIEANVERAGTGPCRMIVTDLGALDAGDSALRRAFIILDNINEGVVITDASNHIVSVNPSFTKITGYLAEEAIGRNPVFLRCGMLPPEFYQEMWRRLEQEGNWQGEVLNRRKDGEPFLEWLSITQLRAPDGSVANFVGVFSDITERKRTEIALRELHRELDQRVVERTAELTRANLLLHQEISERERAEVALRNAEQFFHATIDSLTDRVLVLDQTGNILHANQACSDCAGHVGGGTDYLHYCETDPRWQRGAGAELAAGIRRVIGGQPDAFALEYEFLAFGASLWFHARVSRFLEQGQVRVVVAHSDITERKVMERALRQSHAQLRQLAGHLETAKEDERKRISRDIHDELGQNLLALRIDVSMLCVRTKGSHPRLHRRAAAVLDNIDTTIRSVRGIMNALRPPVLDLGLQAAMEWQTGDFSKRSGIACRLQADGPVFALIGGEIEIVLFRIVQEALTNVLRHARAASVEIVLGAEHGELRLSISDDGIGITPQQRRKSHCFGLIGIAERISVLGGRFEVGPPGQGRGCRLRIHIPLRGARPQDGAPRLLD